MLHVQTFIPNPFGTKEGTLITFANGDRVTITMGFHKLAAMSLAAGVDG